VLGISFFFAALPKKTAMKEAAIVLIAIIENAIIALRSKSFL
jgi:hypothetical protein